MREIELKKGGACLYWDNGERIDPDTDFSHIVSFCCFCSWSSLKILDFLQHNWCFSCINFAQLAFDQGSSVWFCGFWVLSCRSTLLILLNSTKALLLVFLLLNLKLVSLILCAKLPSLSSGYRDEKPRTCIIVSEQYCITKLHLYEETLDVGVCPCHFYIVLPANKKTKFACACFQRLLSYTLKKWKLRYGILWF